MLHFPVSISLLNHTILLHGIMEALGIFIGFRYYLFLKKKEGDPIVSDHRIYILVAAGLGAVLGSRIVGSLENLPQWVAAANPLLYFWTNKTVLGGLFGGLLAVETIKYLLHEKKRSGDLFVYPLLLAMMIGRLGCFSAGIYEETYGNSTALPWGMDLGDGVLRHPVTLYEILFLGLLWYIIYRVNKRYMLASGDSFKIFMIGYFIFRFLLDFIKPGWRYFFGLGTIQVVSLLGLIYYSKSIAKGLFGFQKNSNLNKKALSAH